MKKNILVADDDASIRFVISKSLSKAGFNVRATDNAATLLKWVKSGEGDVILSDVHMGHEDIFNFLPDVKSSRPELPIVIMSANTSVMTALKSGKFGVFEYIPKPFDLSHLQNVIERALGMGETVKDGPKSEKMDSVGPMIGKSAAMQPVYRGISDFTSGDVPIYIHGAIGTGKSLTAKLIHDSGKRKSKPFVYLNDVENAHALLERTQDGDLFVDRILELTPAQQTVLLRGIERNELRSVDQRFRLISTGFKPFQELHTSENLRPELYSHLRGGQIFLPPLRDRQDDIKDLAIFFLNENPNLDRKRKFSKSAFNILNEQEWRGNVRDLRNVVRAIPLQFSDVLITDEIVKQVLAQQFSSDAENVADAKRAETIRFAAKNLLSLALEEEDQDSTPYNTAMAWIEKPLIEEALKITKWNNVKAAELLGIHRNTLRMKIKSLDIKK